MKETPSKVKQKLLRKITESEHKRAAENRALANYRRRVKSLERRENNKQNLKELKILFRSFKVPKRDKNGKETLKSASAVHELMESYTLVSNKGYDELNSIFQLVCKLYKPSSTSRDEVVDELVKDLKRDLKARKIFK